jgi:hypothetical protein
MDKTLIFLILCASAAFPQGDSDHPQHVKYTKYQREAAGFWRVTESSGTAQIAWLAIYLGESRNTMAVRWPTGMGCQNESAEIKKGTITVVGRNFPAVIQIQGPKTAQVSMFGGQVVIHMKKTKEQTDFLCQ